MRNIRNVLVCMVGLVSVVLSGSAGAETLSSQEAVSQALNWMSGNPVMSQAARSVASVSTFSGGGTYFVYVVELSPAGYLILNSDDRLPLMVAFSADSGVDLSEDPQNALRTMLLDYCERMEDTLDTMSLFPMAMAAEAAGEDELHGPFLETSWNQNNPYNLFCPDDPSGSEYYGYRVPSGCVPTAFAQILNFHRWPVNGTGSRSYTDSSGSITGSHSADFSDSYAWDLMDDLYDPWNTNPDPSKGAVAELMYELGVAAGANYESEGTTAGVSTLGDRLGDYLFFESCDYHSSQSNLIVPMEADLRAGFPCVVSVPDHAIVADGLMVDDGVKSYHFNYGWGPGNNGWWTADTTPLGPLESGMTSLRPRLIAFPLINAVLGVAGDVVELEWIMPKRRTNEIFQLEIKSLEEKSGSWSTDASDITGINNGWGVISAGLSGNCWYAEQSSTNNGSRSMVLEEIFVPDSSTQLTFWQVARLYLSRFAIEVSTDDGETYSEIYTAYSEPDDRIYEWDWSNHSVSLAAYAGLEIKLRFSVSSGGYYSGDWPGVRLENLAITGGKWYAWESFAVDTSLAVRSSEEVDVSLEGQPVHYTELSGLSAGTYTLAAVLTDTNAVEHTAGPSFTLTVTGSEPSNDSDGDGLPDDWELQYYGGETNAVTNALAANGINTVMEAYVAGFNPTNSASFFQASLTNQNGFVVRWNSVSGRVYTVHCTTNLTENFLPLATNIVWPQSSWTDNVEHAECFYRVDVKLAE